MDFSYYSSYFNLSFSFSIIRFLISNFSYSVISSDTSKTDEVDAELVIVIQVPCPLVLLKVMINF